jgi:hypothetical protein
MRARAALLLVVVAAGAFGAGPALAPAQSPPPGQVPTTFPVTQGEPFREPTELRSRNGVLDTTFTAADTTFDVGGTAVRGKAYQGTFGPATRSGSASSTGSASRRTSTSTGSMCRRSASPTTCCA